MDAYERLRGEFIAKLNDRCGSMNLDTARKVIGILDECTVKYAVENRSEDLSVQQDGIPEAVRIYLAVKKTEGLSDMTLKVKYYRLKAFFDSVRRPVGMISANDIRSFLFRYQDGRKIANNTLDGFRITLCSFFRWAAAEGYVDRDPGTQLKPIRFEKKQRNSLTQTELEYIRMACVTSREKAMVEFYYSTGCRVSEMANVKIADVNFATKEVTLFGKGRKYRTSYLNAKAEVTLKQYLKERSDDCPYLFCTERKPYRKMTKAALEKIVRVICARVGNQLSKHVTPHVFRHTTATHAVANGMPVNEVQKLLGHSTIATTMVYVETSMANIKLSHARAIV